jgi:hypothetical protein
MKKIILAFLLLPVFVGAQQYDVVISNGKIIDGTGNSWYYGDVAIKDGKIMYVGKISNVSATKVINVKGLSLPLDLLMCMDILKAAYLKIQQLIIIYMME